MVLSDWADELKHRKLAVKTNFRAKLVFVVIKSLTPLLGKSGQVVWCIPVKNFDAGSGQKDGELFLLKYAPKTQVPEPKLAARSATRCAHR